MDLQNQTELTEFILLGFSALEDIQNLLSGGFLIIYLLTLLWNTFIISIAILDKKLRTPMYFFLGNLSFLDICYTTTTVPQMLYHLLSGRNTISYMGCVFQLYLFFSFLGVECLLLAVMAFDRYIAICRPLRYTLIISNNICLQLASACWAGGFLNSLIHAVCAFRLPFCGNNQIDINHFFCEEPAVLQLACMDTYMVKITIFALSVIVLMLPFTFIVVSYIHIARVVLSIQSMEGRKRAFSTCFTHLTVVILFYSTISFTYLQPQSDWAADQEKKASVFYALVSPMLNPIIYSLRNKDVKRALAKVMGKIS
uniref:Olfactory receptor n=1 Tax=Varanus komodoensis TaxID=61221 RepID=A0A8D2IKT8_VARKO